MTDFKNENIYQKRTESHNNSLKIGVTFLICATK